MLLVESRIITFGQNLIRYITIFRIRVRHCFFRKIGRLAGSRGSATLHCEPFSRSRFLRCALQPWRSWQGQRRMREQVPASIWADGYRLSRTSGLAVGGHKGHHACDVPVSTRIVLQTRLNEVWSTNQRKVSWHGSSLGVSCEAVALQKTFSAEMIKNPVRLHGVLPHHEMVHEIDQFGLIQIQLASSKDRVQHPGSGPRHQFVQNFV